MFPKIYVKRDDFDFDIVNFPVLDDDVPRLVLRVYTFRNLLGLLKSADILQTSMREINVLTAKLLQQGYPHHELRRTCSILFCHKHYEMISKFNAGP